MRRIAARLSRRPGFRRHSLLLIGLALALLPVLSPAAVCADDVAVRKLPADCSDFAINPNTGDVVALDVDGNQALLFRHDDLTRGAIEPAASTRVAATPCAICYKQFGETEVFAVVGTQESNLYLLDAVSLEKVKQIAITGAGHSHVFTSRNTADPFIYYNHGSGHGSEAGAISLRSLTNLGTAFDDAMDAAVSASGLYAYRRGPWSPSGFESLVRTSDLTAEKPEFTRLFYDHRSTHEYLPGPFDQVCASGTELYSAGLSQRIASLPFIPSAFLHNRPFILGLTPTQQAGRSCSSRDQAGPPTVAAASYNSFLRVGKTVDIPFQPLESDASLPRGVRSQADFKRVRRRQRLLVDEGHEQVIVANRNQLAIVPLAAFELPDEPYLVSAFHGREHGTVGQPWLFQITPRDKRVSIALENVPDAATVRDGMVNWTPEPDDVGRQVIRAVATFGDLQRSTNFEVNISFPSIELANGPSDLTVSADGQRAVVWTTTSGDAFRQTTGPSATFEISLIDLTTGKTLASRVVTEAIQTCAINDDFVVVTGTRGSNRVDIFSARNLDRIKTLILNTPPELAELWGSLLICTARRGIEVYDLTTFRRTMQSQGSARWHGRSGTPVSPLTRDGLLLNGVLHDQSLKPQLIINPGSLPQLPGADANWEQRSQFAPPPPRQTPGVHTPDRQTVVAVTNETRQVEVPGSVHTRRAQTNLLVTATGRVNVRQLLT